MTYLREDIQKRIDEKLKRLNNLRPMPPIAVKKLQDHFKIEMTYNSNAIEGNSLTLRETYLVINDGMTVKGKPLKDHLEAKNQYEALDFLYKLVESKKKLDINEEIILKLHKLVVLETDANWAGRYRDSWVMITGTDFLPPDAGEIPKLMRELVVWFEKNRKKLHPVELAALLHFKMVNIHPFFDGNGRTSRLVMNLTLMSHSFPLVIVKNNDRSQYYRDLQKADDGDPKAFVLFIAQAVEQSLDIYLKMLTPSGSNIVVEKFLPLSLLSKKFGYPAKYLNLLAHSGVLEAHKEGRNWVASSQAMQHYLDNRKRKR